MVSTCRSTAAIDLTAIFWTFLNQRCPMTLDEGKFAMKKSKFTGVAYVIHA